MTFRGPFRLRILSFYKKEGWSTVSVFLVLWLSFPEEFESLTLKSLHLSTQFLEPKLVKFITTYSYDSAELFQKADFPLIVTQVLVCVCIPTKFIHITGTNVIEIMEIKDVKSYYLKK